ncbi:MAG: threonine ammonia-lyase [Euryarchaeota archaeon]|nr:threonine ammonia-lyase [Euryarchaeota archaeon]
MITLADVEAARERVRKHVHHTPLRHSTTFSKLTGAEVYLKFENLQRTGSFKIRGALNKILQLSPDEKRRGVVAASAGNHAQGVALAASLNGAKATIVMPEHASIQKAEATRGYGAEVILHGKDFNEAQEKCFALAKERNLTLVHAYNDPMIMAGQGTVGLEILDDLPDVDVVVVGVGGGGLISGIGTAVKGKNPRTRVVGVQPEISSSLKQSLAKGKIVPATATNTIADGLATKSVGDKTYEVIKKVVDEALTVTDDEIAHAILLLLERSKNVVEGAGAAPLAALLSGKLKVKGKKVAVVISGGNIDITVLDGIILRGLEEAGRIVRFSTEIGDRPGQLRKLLEVVAENRGNVRDVVHQRNRMGIPLGRTVVELDIETQGSKHRDALLSELKKAGYEVRP